VNQRRLALLFLAPALVAIALVALFPLGWTAWESLHAHDLRLPGAGRPFVGLANFAEAFGDPRWRGAWAHTLFFTAVTVALELGLGLVLALGLQSVRRFRGLLRTAVLLPWALPTVVAALLWRFLFESPMGLVNALLVRSGIAAVPIPWFTHPVAAWVPLILADVWRMTPFATLLLLAGLQTIDEELYEAARLDGAGSWACFRHITLPLLRPALLVVLLFRTLDALRVFDLVYVLTGGGPGTRTEPVALHAWTELLQNLRFGYGSALALLLLAGALLVALGLTRWMGRRTLLGGTT
jgi:ABC-type sugar transport system permease subunit